MPCEVPGCTPHAEGPWAIKDMVFISGSEGTVAVIPNYAYDAANAALIARAPDVTHALLGLVKMVKDGELYWNSDMNAVNAALATAEAALKGETP